MHVRPHAMFVLLGAALVGCSSSSGNGADTSTGGTGATSLEGDVNGKTPALVGAVSLVQHIPGTDDLVVVSTSYQGCTLNHSGDVPAKPDSITLELDFHQYPSALGTFPIGLDPGMVLARYSELNSTCHDATGYLATAGTLILTELSPTGVKGTFQIDAFRDSNGPIPSHLTGTFDAPLCGDGRDTIYDQSSCWQ